MNCLPHLALFDSIEKGISNLREAVNLRDITTGMYYNYLHADCTVIASMLIEQGAKDDEVKNILNK